jgi:tetratricopeptide (TPR) repeat protein
MLPQTISALHMRGEEQHARGLLADAEASFRQVLQLAPDDPFARLSLGAVLNDADRAAEAQPLLAEGFAQVHDPRLKAAYAYHLGLSHYRQGRKQEALDNFSLVRRIDPTSTNVEISRSDILQDLARNEDALALLRDLLESQPLNPDVHQAYNALLYRLGRDAEFLKSYDCAPASADLQLGKANFLIQNGRGADAYEVFTGILMRDPENLDAVQGASRALGIMGQHKEAVTLLEKSLTHFAANSLLHISLAEAALQARDPQKAAVMAQRRLDVAPHDQHGLAVLGSAWRVMDDERDEVLNGYDDLIHTIELEPPQGFSSMADFNQELNAALEILYPQGREPVNQSLRHGSQTRGHIFGASHDLVEKLKQRIVQALSRYIADIGPDARHPFRGRRTNGFRFTGSWSSRLSNCGYHTNHIHPEGWISSCYYVSVPPVVNDEAAQQGWIKFGQPSFDIGLGVRRSIQPVPGRLLLFPSYMWHGTVPFQDSQPRTTIAFDALPR